MEVEGLMPEQIRQGIEVELAKCICRPSWLDRCHGLRESKNEVNNFFSLSKVVHSGLHYKL